MPAPADPLADFIAALLAIIDGLCRALAEQAGGEAGRGLRARGLTRLQARLRRMSEELGEELAKETAGANFAHAHAETDLRAVPPHPRHHARTGRRPPPRRRSGPAPRRVQDSRPRSPPAICRLGGP